MLCKIQAGGQEQHCRGMERWETSYTVSKESAETRRGSGGEERGPRLGGMLRLRKVVTSSRARVASALHRG